MKKYLYIFCTLTGAALMGCTDLDLIPEDTMAPENYFSSEEELRQYTNAYYGMLPGADDLNDICADDVIKNILDNEILGNRYPSTEKAWDWDDLRVINYYFENSGACKDQNARRHYDGFSYFMRAYFYFTKLQRYGDVPYYDEVIGSKDEELLYKPRDSRKYVMQKVVEDLDSAIYMLPETKTPYEVNKWTALALKSRALLYAASLLHNPAQDADKWKAAADAAYAIIKENWYSLPKTNVDPLYDKNGGNDVLKSPQLIFERRNGESFDFEANNLPISYEKGKTGNVPTQNLVDAFQMTNGKDFDWEQITPGQNPYEGRDPRFYKTVLCNGDTWMNSTIQSYEGGKDGAGTTGATTTGYYLKKYMNETVSLAPSNEKKKPHHFIIFRYAEILLNYAEAMDAWKDADYTDNDHPLSARAALNQVRAAADMPAITTSGNAFTESVRRERRVELAFEDHRFWDIRRWRIGDKTKAIYCIKITMENGLPVYKKELLETRNWDDKMYLYPIPQTEYYKNPNLGQNTGW